MPLKQWLIVSASAVAVLIVVVVVLRAETKSGRATLTALDYAQIQELNAEYGQFIDTGEGNGYAWADLFTADGVFARQSGENYVGREKLAALARHRGGAKFVSHFVTNVMVQPTDGGATGRAYCVTMQFPDNKIEASDPRPSEVQLGCRYHDVYARTADGWRFKSRTVVVSEGHLPPR
jgi:hypothetical protein